jgi:signal transduction histidine kinase
VENGVKSEASSSKQWPFYPAYLSELVEEKFVKLLLGGLIQRLGVFAIILEKRECGKIKEIFPEDGDSHYPDLCKLFRSEDAKLVSRLTPKGQSLLQDLSKRCYEDTRRRGEAYFGETQDLPLPSACHMGLRCLSAPIQIDKRTIGVLIAGKYIHKGDRSSVLQHIEASGFDGDDRSIFEGLVDNITRNEAQIAKIRNDYIDQYALINRMAHGFYVNRIEDKGWRFRVDLGEDLNQTTKELAGDINTRFKEILAKIRDFFQVTFVAVFCSTGKDDNVLPLVAYAGLEDGSEHKVHFNWRKALLPVDDSFDSYQWLEDNKRASFYPARFLEKGCRGENPLVLRDASFLLPYLYGSHYRGVFILGPYRSKDDSAKTNQRVTLRREVGYSVLSRILTAIIIDALSHKDNDIEKLSQLWTHAIRTDLQGLFGEISIIDGAVKDIAPAQYKSAERVKLAMERIKATVRTMKVKTILAKKTQDAVISGLLSPTELSKRLQPWAPLILNCVERMEASAKLKNLSIVVVESANALYPSEIDVDMITIVLQNIIDNAIKYSKAGEEIRISADRNALRENVISIENHGIGIPGSELSSIFEFGHRSKVVGTIEGGGLGLYQAKNILEAHGGAISATSRPAYSDAPIRGEFITVITITIPTKFT